jgi:hypothetical protein
MMFAVVGACTVMLVGGWLWLAVHADKARLSPELTLLSLIFGALFMGIGVVDMLGRRRTWWRVWPDRVEVWRRGELVTAAEWAEVGMIDVRPFGMRLRASGRDRWLYWQAPADGRMVGELWRAARGEGAGKG